MPAGSSCRLLSSFTCWPYEGGTMHLLLSRHCSGVATEPLRGAALLFLAKRMIRHTLADHRRALQEIQDHVSEWIAVRPLPLTNGPWTGKYRTAVDGIPAKSSHIARADVADFMMRQATDNSYLNKAPAIAY
jgi:hypothetical protein